MKTCNMDIINCEINNIIATARMSSITKTKSIYIKMLGIGIVGIIALIVIYLNLPDTTAVYKVSFTIYSVALIATLIWMWYSPKKVFYNEVRRNTLAYVKEHLPQETIVYISHEAIYIDCEQCIIEIEGY